MSCISSNFSSFFLNSLNDPSEFSKYLSNGELRFSSTFEDFQVYGQNNVQQQQQQQSHFNGSVMDGEEGNSNIENTQPIATSMQHYGSYHGQNQQQIQQHHQQQQTRWALPQQQANIQQNLPQNTGATSSTASGTQHFDGSFEFMKYLRHSNDYSENSHDATGQQNQMQSSHATAVGTKPEASLNNGLMDLDSAHKRATARKTPVLSSANSNHHNPTTGNSSHPTPMDIYDHDSKHNIYDLHHMNSVHSSNSNESSMELSSMTYPNSHLNASNSNTSSEGGNTQNHSDFSMLSGVENSQNSSTANAASTTVAATAAAASPAAPKPLATFNINDNFEVHPSHKVEEGIFQHMNKLPSKKKDNLKQLGVRFTGQMTLNDKSIIVENFIKFCQEYEITDHRPFLSLNQSGLNKPDQIKFARYLGQGLPTFTLFCIYSNFKNLFCTKRTEIYTKEGYNLPYILDKIKRFLANTTAGNNNNNASNSSSTSTTTKDSSSNTNSTNLNSNPNTTIAVSANNYNINNNAATAASVVMQNGSSSKSIDNSNSSNANSTGNDNGKVNGNINSNSNSIISNDIINTPTKQIHNVPSQTTPRTPQIQQQQTPQIPIQQTHTHTQNTPLSAHPPPTHANTHIMANHTTTPQAHLHSLQHQQHQHQQQQLPQQPQQHHHVQVAISPMVVVTSAAASVAAPPTIMAAPLPPTVPTPATITQSTTNHNQHPHHMQPNNHLPLHHHTHHHIHPVAQPSIQQHHATATVVYQQQQQQHPHTHHLQQQQQQHHHQKQLQNHHPLHNLAAQNPPL